VRFFATELWNLPGTLPRIRPGKSVRTFKHQQGALIMKALKLVALLLALGVIPTLAVAKKTPDEKTPSEESVCDILEGSEYGICNAYCEASDCGDGVNYANWKACASLQKNWQKKTGLDQLPCDCDEGSVYLPGEGCGCGHDLVITILAVRSPICPTGQGSCEHEVDIEVENLGSLDIVDPFDVLVEMPGVGLGAGENFPTGLGAGMMEQRLNIPLGPGDNCFDPDCEVQATVDVGNVIDECDENNNRDFQIYPG
jgi:hypothetical protein